MRKLRKFVWRAALAGIIFAIINMAVLVTDGLRNETEPTDLGVILGSKVYPSGNPSQHLTARMNHGIELFKKGEVKALMVSGGFGKEGHDEAKVMQRFLIKSGVPSGKIIVDSKGIDTRHTAKHAKAEMDQLGLASAKVISQYFHISRCKLAFRQAGIETVGGSAPWFFQGRDAYSLPREMIGWWAYLLRLK